MTDMYTFPTDNQVMLFFLSVGFGFLLGIFYDILRVIRLLVSRGTTAVIVFDIIFALSCALFTYIFLLTVNKGSVRAYMILGEFLGGFFYYVSFGSAVIRITDRLVRLIRRAVSRFFTFIFSPFRRLIAFFKRKLTQYRNFLRKKEKKHKKNLKKLLQSAKVSLYNLYGLFSVTKNKESRLMNERKHKKEQ